MPKSTLKILPAVMVAITAALVTHPMRAGVINTIVITENSSTSLTATLNGTALPESNLGADLWTIDLAGVSGSPGQQNWMEPGAAGVFNFVQGQPNPANQIIVHSDNQSPGGTGLADGTPDTTSFTLNGNPVFVTFFDKGDVATASDTGTTLSLFGLSLMGLGFLRRKLC